MNRDTFFLVSVILCLLIGSIVLDRLPAALPHVYVNLQYGQSIFGGQPGHDRMVACVGLPHFGNAGLLFCEGDLIYHPFAYNVPIDDRKFIAEIQDMKRLARSHGNTSHVRIH